MMSCFVITAITAYKSKTIQRKYVLPENSAPIVGPQPAASLWTSEKDDGRCSLKNCA